MLRYRLFKLLAPLAGRLPEPLGYALAGLLGDLAHLVMPGARAVVRANLEPVLPPGTSSAYLRRTVREVFRNAAKDYFELLRLPHIDLRRLERNVTIEGWGYFEEALARGKGVIVVSAHLGNFNLAAQIMAARSIPFHVLVEPLEPPEWFAFVSGLRRSKGLHLVPTGSGAMKKVLRVLRAGGVVALAADRDIQRNGMVVDFFGRETSLPVGAINLAWRTGAVLLPAYCLRQKNDKLLVCAEPPLNLELPLNGDVNGDVEARRRNLQRVSRIMERQIRKDPAQWVVFEPIWPAPLPTTRAVRAGQTPLAGSADSPVRNQ